MVTSKTHQVVELVLGILWALASFATVWFIKKYLHKTMKIE